MQDLAELLSGIPSVRPAPSPSLISIKDSSGRTSLIPTNQIVRITAEDGGKTICVHLKPAPDLDDYLNVDLTYSKMTEIISTWVASHYHAPTAKSLLKLIGETDNKFVVLC